MLATNMYRQKLQALLDELPAGELRQVYYFTIFLHNQLGKEEPPADFPTAPVEHLQSLVGLISLGGDALQDTEAVYE
jgi:hypothetical protein